MCGTSVNCVERKRSGYAMLLGLLWTTVGAHASGAESPPREILVRGSAVHHLGVHHLAPHASHLEHLSIIDVPKLGSLEAGCISILPHLRSLYIWRAPLLKHLPHDILIPSPPSLRSLRIINSGLEELPDLSKLADNGHLMHIIDFEGNKLKKLHSRRIRVRADQLFFDGNEIVEIEEYAFAGSELAELSLKGNKYLSILHDLSFAGIIGIRELDISDTAITFLPAVGLSSLEVLKAQNIISMKTIPSIHDFKQLKQAYLTHHFHCCAFKFPERHNPERHGEYLTYAARMNKLCSRAMDEQKRISKEKRHIDSINITDQQIKVDMKHSTTEVPISTLKPLKSGDLKFLDEQNVQDDVYDGPWSELIIDSQENDEDSTKEYDEEMYDEDTGTFHQTPIPTPAENMQILCGNFTETSWEEVHCWPQSDALNPCEDVLGSEGARGLGWGAGIAATIGNLAVGAVLITRPLVPPRLLLLQLVVADLGTALYLVLISAVDTYTADNYFNYAYDWQYGIGCRLAGFLAIWGAQASLLALAALTLERWLAITHALLPQRRLSSRNARLIVLASTVYSLLLASAPLLGASHYSSTSICLPMRLENWVDTVYLVCLLSGGLFCLLAVIGCYVHIYVTLAKDTPRSSTIAGDARVANKMAILIAIHMACCVPVAVVGFGALIGHPILGVHGAKLLLVIIYPLNSLADPFLYAILTHPFRRDLYLLLDRYGLCSRRAQQYKIPGVVGRERLRNNSNRVPRRPDGSLTTAYEDMLL